MFNISGKFPGNFPENFRQMKLWKHSIQPYSHKLKIKCFVAHSPGAVYEIPELRSQFGQVSEVRNSEVVLHSAHGIPDQSCVFDIPRETAAARIKIH